MLHSGLYLPLVTTQSLQAAFLSPTEYLPSGQAWQPSVRVFPPGLVSSVLTPQALHSAGYLPELATQSVHAWLPEPVEYFPAGHAMHPTPLVAPPGFESYVFGGQLLHSGPYLPFVTAHVEQAWFPTPEE